MNKDAYEETLKYLFGLEKFGMVFGLDNIKWLLNTIENPHTSIKTAHIAGTNGKGSTATMLTSILKEGGFRVGKYTSPHVVSFTERITVNEEEITEKEVVDLTAYVRARAEEKDKGRFFTFFDFTTALACEYFRREKVDIAVMETGLGGRLDSTNVVEPLVSIITNVDYDHMEQLGSGLKEIAGEKAGIIKKGVPVVTGCEGAAREVVEAKANELQSPLYLLGRDFSFEKVEHNRLAYKSINGDVHSFSIGLDGDHQFRNASLSLCAAEILSTSGFSVGYAPTERALAQVKMQGRLEKVKENPLILLDAAHNPQGIHALSDYVKSSLAGKKKILVFGVMKDKDYERMVQELTPIMDVVIFTKPAIERSLVPDAIQPSLKHAIITYSIRNALEKAKMIATEQDVILVTGSFYTIGEAKTVIDEIF